VKSTPTERDLDGLSEPTRSRAFELLWLLRESGCSEELAIRLAVLGAQEAPSARPGGSGFAGRDTTVRAPRP
jgi:hypothetical protein